MLAKRFIVVAFAALVVLGFPMAFSGKPDLFRDTPEGLLTSVASASTLTSAN